MAWSNKPFMKYSYNFLLLKNEVLKGKLTCNEFEEQI